MAQQGLFITGTDTGAGKTFVTAAIAASLIAADQTVVVRKPLLTGMAEPSTPSAPHDHELLAAATGQNPLEIAPLRFDPAVSPHLAAESAGVELDVKAIAEATLASSTDDEILLVEGVGGWLVPITRSESVADLAVQLDLPVVIAARPGLGTISHCLLTIEAVRKRGLEVRAVVMGPWPTSPTEIERDNVGTVAEISGVPVATIPLVTEITDSAFQAAGHGLPAADWL